jgi:hypothetical protein
MKKTNGMQAALVLAVLAAAVPSRALDPWEGTSPSDDTFETRNTMGPGSVQQHDLDQNGTATNDVDWIVVPTIARHSYEMRLNGSGGSWSWGQCTDCGQFERVDLNGTILTDDASVINDGDGGPGDPEESYDRTIRWIADSTTLAERVRVTGATDASEDASSVYTLRFWDTTYTIPRWNSSGGQVTVIVLTNITQNPNPIQITVSFYDSLGALIYTQGSPLLSNRPWVFSTASVSTLVGRSGFAKVAHTAGYGGLSGKAVALEPATGFTFDTELTPIPQ